MTESTKPVHPSPIREHHSGGCIGLIDGGDDVTMRHQLLKQMGAFLAKTAAPGRKQQHWITGFAIGHRWRGDGVGLDVFKLVEEKPWQMEHVQELRKHIGVFDVWRTR